MPAKFTLNLHWARPGYQLSRRERVGRRQEGWAVWYDFLARSRDAEMLHAGFDVTVEDTRSDRIGRHPESVDKWGSKISDRPTSIRGHRAMTNLGSAGQWVIGKLRGIGNAIDPQIRGCRK